MFFGPNVRSEEIFCEIRLEGSREGGGEERRKRLGWQGAH